MMTMTTQMTIQEEFNFIKRELVWDQTRFLEKAKDLEMMNKKFNESAVRVKITQQAFDDLLVAHPELSVQEGK
jgi:hypothetical protein